MSVGGITSGAATNYHYTGAASAKPALDAASSSKAAGPTQPQASQASDDAVVVTISEAAKAALAASSTATETTTGGSLRDRLDSQYSAAAADGTYISIDITKGRQLDFSSFSDEELAQIKLGKGGNFSEDEKLSASATLGGRMAESLRPYQAAVQIGDRRGHTMAINALYSQMSDNVRAALGWTPAMMVSNNSMMQGDSAGHGWLSLQPILSNLFDASDRGGLHFTRDRLGSLPQMGPNQA